MACQNLNAGYRAAYNNALACITRRIDDQTPNELHTQLDSLGVTLDVPAVKLPLVWFHAVCRSRLANESAEIGV